MDVKETVGPAWMLTAAGVKWNTTVLQVPFSETGHVTSPDLLRHLLSRGHTQLYLRTLLWIDPFIFSASPAACTAANIFNANTRSDYKEQYPQITLRISIICQHVWHSDGVHMPPDVAQQPRMSKPKPGCRHQKASCCMCGTITGWQRYGCEGICCAVSPLAAVWINVDL